MKCLIILYPCRGRKPVTASRSPIAGICFHSEADIADSSICNHHRITASLFQNHFRHCNRLHSGDRLFKFIRCRICSCTAFRIRRICDICVYLNLIRSIIIHGNYINFAQRLFFSITSLCLVNSSH